MLGTVFVPSYARCRKPAPSTARYRSPVPINTDRLYRVQLGTPSVARGVYSSEKEAYEMYCNYAHNLLAKFEEHKSKDFVCSRAGYKKGIDLNSQAKYRKSNTRTGCPTMIRFAVSQDGVWTVQKFIESHNHELARRADQHLLRSCRNISDEKVSVLKFMIEAAESKVQCTYGKFSMMGILCSHIMRVFRQLDICKIPSQYILFRWSARGRKDIYAGPTVNAMGNKPSQSSEGGTCMIFRNHLSRFAYQISTRAQGNEDAEQYMLSAMVEMADNVDFILAGQPNKQSKKQNIGVVVHKKVKDPVKCRPKSVSNAKLKSHWEKKKLKRRRTTNSDTDSKEESAPGQPFVHATCSTIPECLTDEFILRRPTSMPSAEYTRMMMRIIESDRHS
ncbi:hypothetical protein M5K25_023466 [Dendrobium thyrsiflorum]|uniref:Protein FAR1-RELATED SEQUENCE n=1 Tax=Dendrobium thyrsiflorum TaxID=117978 RepID=A0ABD0UF10_DENTH